MPFIYSPYTLPLFAAALLSSWVAIYSWGHRRAVASALALSILAASLTEWSIGYAFEIGGADLPTKLFWAKSQYLGIAAAPYFWMLFALNHSGYRKRLTRNQVFILGLVPILTILLAISNEVHGLIWRTIEIKQIGNFSALGVTYGTWFWVHSAYSYLLLLSGSVMLLRTISWRQAVYRWQAVVMLVAVLAPWVGNIIYLSGLSPLPNLDLTPFMFTVTVLALNWAIFRFQLLDLAPVARDNVIERMQDGMIVLDPQNQIIDINPAARKMLGLSSEALLIGQPATQVFGQWPELVSQCCDKGEIHTILEMDTGMAKRKFELRVTPFLSSKNRIQGRVAILRDDTENIRADDLKQAFLEDMRALQELHLALSEIEKLDDLYIKMIELAQKRLGLDRVGLFVLDDQNHQLLGTFGVDQHGLVRDERYYVEPITPGHWTFDILHSSNHAKIWDEAPLFDNGQIVGTGWKAATTLWNGQKAVGYLVCDNLFTRKMPRTYETELISVIGSTFGHLIERKRSEQQLLQRVSQLSVIDQLGREIVATLNGEEVFSSAHRAVATLMPLDVFYISLLDEQRQEIQDVYMFDSGKLWPNVRRPLSEQGLSAHVILTGKPLFVKDDAEGKETSLQGRVLFGVPEDTRSVMIIPLSNKGKVIGVMSVQHYQPNMYTYEHLNLFTLMGNQVAVAVENAQLVESLQLQAAALDAAANAIVITDRSGTIQWVNRAFTALTGYQFEEALGAPTRMLNSGHHNASFFKNLWETILNGKIWEGEVINRRKNGTEYFEHQTITPLRNPNGEINRFISIKQDVSELIRARDQALEANRLKSQFLAKISHELRTPLGGILGYAELLHHDMIGPLDLKQKQATSQIIESTNYLNTMVNELLDEAQIESRTIILQRARFSPAMVLERAETSLTVLAQKKGLDFSTRLDPEVPSWLYGDEYRLHQIMINLAGNAIKFTKAGEVRIHLTSPTPTQWAILVTDTGSGIPPEALEYIFEPFRQVDNAITRENRGTGLGLAITKQLVELMGGTITVESELGQGSTFTVFLPQITELEK